MKESTLQHQIITPYILNLGFLPPPGNTSSCVDTKSGFLKEDFLVFLKQGNPTNAKNWNAALAEEKKNDMKDAEKRLEKKAFEELQKKMDASKTVLAVLREGIAVLNFPFSLWNPPPQTGDTEKILAQHLFNKNNLRLAQETSVKRRNTLQNEIPFAGKFNQGNPQIHKRIDQMIFINGIPYGLTQIKSKLSEQSAKEQGLRQIAEDFIDFALVGLSETKKAYNGKTFSQHWKSLRTLSSVSCKNAALSSFPSWFGKLAWQVVMDEEDMYLAPSPWMWLLKVDDFLTKSEHADFDFQKERQDLINDLVKDFSRMPRLLLEDGAKPTDTVKGHLRSLLSPENLALEVALHGYPTQAHDSKQTDEFLLTGPRAPQRAVMGQIQRYLHEMYRNEHDKGWIERDLRRQLEKSMPGLSLENVEKKIAERLKFKNGQEAYSIIVQGAAGLGKTNIAVWTALYLAGLLEKHNGKETSQHMFDFLVILTDRLDLRRNMMTTAERNNSKGLVVEIETSQDLRDVLAGQYSKGVGRILIVNLQKFPHFKRDVQQAKAKIKRSGGRIAFIIDEIHRSNQGSMNMDTQDSFDNKTNDENDKDFVDTLENLSLGQGSKRNLVIGLTATPSDPILARFGQWRVGKGLGSIGNWAPHFSYGMNDAIEDGHVLNALTSLVRLETTLKIDESYNREYALKEGKALDGNISQQIYSNKMWQQKTAREVAHIFVNTTMQSIRDRNRANKVGRGKMMITLPSIATAVTFMEELKKELFFLAQNAKGKAWENWADIVQDVADNRIFILYSDPSDRAPFNEKCWDKNPPLNGQNRNQKQIIEGFRCKEAGSDGNKRNSIIIVVDKLLTGFDEPTLHTLVIAKNMSGISLLQAMCRINRTHNNKNNCLVVDASAGDGLGKEAARVFGKYGGLALSDLDGTDLLNRVTEQGKTLRTKYNGAIQKGFQQWKKDRFSETSIHDNILDVVHQLEKEPEPENIRREVGSYLSQQKLAFNIMQLHPNDTNEHWIIYLKKLHNALAVLSGSGPESRIPVQFTIEDVGLTLAAEEVMNNIKPLRDKSPQDIMEYNLSSDQDMLNSINETLGKLSEIEEEKRRAVSLLRQTTQDITQQMDKIVEQDLWMLQEAKKALRQEFDYDMQVDIFTKNLARVCISTVEDGKDWMDADPMRRKIVKWLELPGRKETVMAHWIAESRLLKTEE